MRDILPYRNSQRSASICSCEKPLGIKTKVCNLSSCQREREKKRDKKRDKKREKETDEERLKMFSMLFC